MKNKTQNLCQLLAFAAAGSMSLGALASTPFSTAIPPGPEQEEIEFSAKYLNKDSVRIHRYTGPVEEGMQYGVDINALYKDGEKDNRYSQFQVKGLGTNSQYFKARVGEQGNYSTAFEYRERPLFHYLDLSTPLHGNSLHLPTLGAGQSLGDVQENWDIKHKRESIRISGQKVLNREWRMNVLLNREDKTGRRLQGYGEWFSREGFQMPAPIDQRTDQAGLTLEYAGKKLQSRMGYHVSEFKQLGDEYFLVDDAFTANPANPRRRHMAMSPDSTHQQLNASMAYQFSADTRVSTELDYGRARQDNRFVRDPDYSNVLSLIDMDSLNAKFDTTRFALRGTHRVNNNLRLRANYRFDDRNTRTTMHRNLPSEFGTLRTMRPIDLRRHTMDIDANMRVLNNSTLLLGVKYEDTDRLVAARSETEETTVHGRLRTRISPAVSTGLKLSYAERVGSTYDDTVTGNHEALRKYHLASVDRSNVAANINWNALEQMALGAEITWKEDRYKKSELGLQSDDRMAYTLTADYFPSSRLSGYGYFTYENGERDQTGLTQQLRHELRTYTVGLGGRGDITEDGRWGAGADILYITSYTDIKAQQGADFNKLKNKLRELRLYGDWKPRENTTLKLMYMAHQYRENDWALDHNQVGTNSSYWFMGAENYSQTVHMIMGSVAYRF